MIGDDEYSTGNGVPSFRHNTSFSTRTASRVRIDSRDRAFLFGIRRAVLVRVVHQAMHVPPEHLIAGEPEHLGAGAVQKRAAALQVDAVEPFIGRFEQRFEGDEIGGGVWPYVRVATEGFASSASIFASRLGNSTGLVS